MAELVHLVQRVCDCGCVHARTSCLDSGEGGATDELNGCGGGDSGDRTYLV